MSTSTQAESRKQASYDAERVRAFQLLVASDGWKYFIKLLDEKVQGLADGMFERPMTEDDRRGEDHDKGVCYGLLWARDLPSVTITAFRDQDSDPATEGSDE